MGRESSLLPHRCESVPRNLREQLRGVQPAGLGLDDRPDCRREPRVFDDLPGLIWCVVTGSVDEAGGSAQFAGINIGKGAGIGTIDEEVRGIRGGIVDQVQVGHPQIGQDSANVDPLLLEAFKPVGDVTDRCDVPHAVASSGRPAQTSARSAAATVIRACRSCSCRHRAASSDRSLSEV